MKIADCAHKLYLDLASFFILAGIDNISNSLFESCLINTICSRTKENSPPTIRILLIKVHDALFSTKNAMFFKVKDCRL